jgi:predicted nucleic acid-binding protein
VPIVIDASALAEIVLRSERAASVEALLDDDVIVAPDIIGAEVLSVVRGLLMRGRIDQEIATRSVDNLASAPVRRMTTEHLVHHVWSCRSNLTPYDATYVTLARAAGAPLVTLDARLARAPALGIEVRCPLTSP